MKDATENAHLNVPKKRGSNPNNTLQAASSMVDEKAKVILSSKLRWFIASILLLVTTIVNMDHGTVPAATREIKLDLHIDDQILGVFGSLVFLGNLIGSMMSFTIINIFNRKFLLIGSLLFNAVCLYTFTLTGAYWFLFINRTVVGLFQAYISIYSPVWCDQFGNKNYKSILISIIQIGSPLGVVFGYYLTFLWSTSFTLQAILLCGVSLIIAFIPNDYFSADVVRPTDQHFVFGDSPHYNSMDNRSSHHQQQFTANYPDTVFVDLLKLPRGSYNPAKSLPILSMMVTILKQKVFLFGALALSSLFFIITAVQYWATDYMKDVLVGTKEADAVFSFTLICVTSPTLGVLSGGLIVNKMGGYEAKHSILACLIFGICAAIPSVFVPMCTTLLYFTIFLWLVLFFGGAIVPPMTGIIISSLPVDLRGSANSVTSIFSNLFGYLPAPFFYGVIYNYTKRYNNKIAFQVVMYFSFIGVLFLILAAYFRYKYFEKNEKRMGNLLEQERPPLISNMNEDVAKVFGNYVKSHSADEVNKEHGSPSKYQPVSPSKSTYGSSNLNLKEETPSSMSLEKQFKL